MVHSWAENMWIESCSPHGGGGHFARAEKIMPLFILHIGSPSGPSASSTNDSAPSNFGRIRKMFCVCHSERHSRTRTHTQSVTKCSVGEPFLPIHSLNLLCSVNRRLRSYFSVFCHNSIPCCFVIINYDDDEGGGGGAVVWRTRRQQCASVVKCRCVSNCLIVLWINEIV